MFKKIFMPISVATCLVLMFFVCNFPVFYNYTNKLEIYDNGKSAGEIINVNSLSSIFIHKYGEAIYLDKDEFCLQNFLNDFNASIIFTENLENGTCYYAYSPQIKYVEKINGKNINLHVYVGKLNVKVGSPLIYGGY